MSKQTKSKDPQQTNFIGKLENQGHGTTIFFIIGKSEETTFNFSQNSVTIIKIMETQKIVNLLNAIDNENSKFASKKGHVIDSESKGVYSHENEIKLLTNSLESNLCGYSDAYDLVTGNITAVGANNNTKVAFKNCAPFRKCRTAINKTFADDTEHINIAMPMYSLIEYQ